MRSAHLTRTRAACSSSRLTPPQCEWSSTCSRSATEARQSLRNRGSRRSGNGAGCCTRSTYSDRQSLRNRGSRRSSGNGACGCTALVLRGSSLPRTRQPLTRRRCSCEGLSAAASASGPMPEPADRRTRQLARWLAIAETGSKQAASWNKQAAKRSAYRCAPAARAPQGAAARARMPTVALAVTGERTL